MSFITIEASHIYFRGGFVLLEQILDYCEENQLSAKVYLGYKEVYQYFIEKKYRYLTLEQTTGIATILRYFRKRENVLFFCNLPPFVRCGQSVLYAHNILFFQSPHPDRGASWLFKNDFMGKIYKENNQKSLIDSLEGILSKPNERTSQDRKYLSHCYKIENQDKVVLDFIDKFVDV
jgi:hypothetical protein